MHEGWTWDGRYPHCDARIVHKPGACVVCDEHASMLQEIRRIWGINFTGEHVIETENGTPMLPCPAEVARPLDVINRWSGNTAKTQEMLDNAEKMFKSLADKFREETKGS